MLRIIAFHSKNNIRLWSLGSIEVTLLTGLLVTEEDQTFGRQFGHGHNCGIKQHVSVLVALEMF